jgi:uncharacterized protein
MVELTRQIPAPDNWGLELVTVPPLSAVDLDIRLESVVEGVLVTIELRAPLAAECGRCLDPIEDELEVNLAELFVYAPDPDDDEVSVLDGDFIDLEPVLRDAVVLALPLNPVCDEDCLGLCADCGARISEVGPDHVHEVLDPRWGALAALETTPAPESGILEGELSRRRSPSPSAGPAPTTAVQDGAQASAQSSADASEQSATRIRES